MLLYVLGSEKRLHLYLPLLHVPIQTHNNAFTVLLGDLSARALGWTYAQYQCGFGPCWRRLHGDLGMWTLLNLIVHRPRLCRHRFAELLAYFAWRSNDSTFIDAFVGRMNCMFPKALLQLHLIWALLGPFGLADVLIWSIWRNIFVRQGEV